MACVVRDLPVIVGAQSNLSKYSESTRWSYRHRAYNASRRTNPYLRNMPNNNYTINYNTKMSIANAYRIYISTTREKGVGKKIHIFCKMYRENTHANVKISITHTNTYSVHFRIMHDVIKHTHTCSLRRDCCFVCIRAESQRQTRVAL